MPPGQARDRGAQRRMMAPLEGAKCNIGRVNRAVKQILLDKIVKGGHIIGEAEKP